MKAAVISASGVPTLWGSYPDRLRGLHTDSHLPSLSSYLPDVLAVAARGSYQDWFRDVSALVRSKYPEQAYLLDRLSCEDEVIAVFVNLVVSPLCLQGGHEGLQEEP